MQHLFGACFSCSSAVAVVAAVRQDEKKLRVFLTLSSVRQAIQMSVTVTPSPELLATATSYNTNTTTTINSNNANTNTIYKYQQ